MSHKALVEFMEELQSTEILEREIMEDAGKKAQRILKNADDAIRAKTAEWDKKTTDTIDELNKKYNARKELAATRIMARLPVDKLRLKIEKIENLLHEAVERWYKDLSSSRVVDLLTKELTTLVRECPEITGAAKVNAYYSGIDRGEAEKILRGACPDVSRGFEIMEESAASEHPEITLETEDVRVIASIQKTIEYYLQEKRVELIEALVGKAFVGED